MGLKSDVRQDKLKTIPLTLFLFDVIDIHDIDVS